MDLFECEGGELGCSCHPSRKVGFEGFLIVVAEVFGFADLPGCCVGEMNFFDAIEEALGAVAPGFVSVCLAM